MSTKIFISVFLVFTISSESVSGFLLTDLPPVPEDGGKLWVVLAAGEEGGSESVGVLSRF
jgi:hypothetical protein